MSDWPQRLERGRRFILSTHNMSSVTGMVQMVGNGRATTAAAVGAANRMMCYPVMLPVKAIAYKMSFTVGAQAGNYDIGILDMSGNRLVSLGTTAVPAAGLAIADIPDTVLNPGIYLLATVFSTITTLTVNRSAPGNVVIQACGALTLDLGSTAIPATNALINTGGSGQVLTLTSAHMVATV